jgi:hypothetical protein
MKKILGLLCIFTLVTIVFAGCSHNKNTAEKNPGETNTTAAGTTGEAGTGVTTAETGKAGATGETGTVGTGSAGTTGETGTTGMTGSTGTETPSAGTTPGTETPSAGATPGTETPSAGTTPSTETPSSGTPESTVGAATPSAGTSGATSAATSATPTDADLLSQIRTNLKKESLGDLSGLRINIKDGDVTLSGPVQTQEQAQKIVTLVRSITGVKNVTNNLKVQER